ncbi:MAG TPA: MFS transporter [Ktedonobacteraceae bacterium]|jgi:YNFM family putative membrane transporter
MEYIGKGNPAFRKVAICLFLGGLVTFATMYCVQPLLPLYSHDFHVSPSTTSLVLSATTALLAVMITFASTLSNAWGRKNIMTFSLFSTSFITLVSSFSPNFTVLLLCRALQGIVLAGIPAIAMVYLGEEVHPQYLGAAMGLYIGGTAFGGMLGRIASGVLTDLFSWRIAILCIGLMGLICSWYFWKYLPSSKHFVAQPIAAKHHIHGQTRQLRNPALLCLYGIALLLMGSFVTLYSYSGYQLIAPPYNLSQALIGWIFSIYIIGSLGSSWLSSLADRWPRRWVLLIGVVLVMIGTLTTLNGSLLLKLFGVAAVTFGFFGCHAIASSWVSIQAGNGKAHASALYMFFYYAGSSIGNTAGGFFWSMSGWPGVIGMISVFLLLCLVLVLILPILSVRRAENHTTH